MQEEGSVTTLLPECWQHIMRFLGPCSLLNCASVCSKWRDWARADHNWERHVKRVEEKLGCVIQPCERNKHNFSLWRLFKGRLLGYENRPWSNRFRLRSLILLPGAPHTWHVTFASVIFLSPVTNQFSIDLWKDPIYTNGVDVDRIEVAFREDANMTSGTDMRNLPLDISCAFDRGVRPALWRRYHSIVRDTDCVGERDERYWLRVFEDGAK